jgi:hypothetical protein
MEFVNFLKSSKIPTSNLSGHVEEYLYEGPYIKIQDSKGKANLFFGAPS